MGHTRENRGSFEMEVDNGPAFKANLVQKVSKTLKMKWKLHTAYRPQSSGTVEGTNWTLKEILSSGS